MMLHHRRLLSVLLFAGHLFWGVGLAVAQQQSGQGGHALDASQQSASGGVNQASRQVDYAARNDVVTGNVPGGRAFQGTVGYGAPGEFGLGITTLPSDELFTFSINSLASSPQRLNATSRRGVYGGPSVHRNSTVVPAYRPSGRNLNSARLQSGRAYQVTPTLLGQYGVKIGADDSVVSRRTAIDTLGVMRHADGSSLEVNASPLLGVREFYRGPTVRPSAATLGDVFPEVDEPLEDRTVLTQTSGMQLSSGIGVTGRFAQQAAFIAPSIILGQQLQLRLQPTPGDETAGQRLTRLEEAMFSRLGSTSLKPGEDAYLDLLTAMRDQQESSGQEQPADPLAAESTDALSSQLPEPSYEQLEAAEKARRAMLQLIYGAAAEDAEDAVGADEQSAVDEQLTSFLDRLTYNLPPLETLAGTRKTKTNRLLKQAEADLVAGKYFAAESFYRQALDIRPNDPMVRVGLIHAQLGAGIIRSAELNLRKLFEQHPEVIAARYDSNLLPSEDRLRWVQGELQKAINGPRASSKPALMMAYLGYQVGSRQLVRYGLAVAETHSPKDPLLALLRHIWLDQADQEAPAPPAPVSDEGK
jgi:tetratricopeptide (TPR) repeat protein